MATRDMPIEKNNSFISGSNENDQYSNLNLNQTYKCSNDNSGESENLFNQNGRKSEDVNDFLQTKEDKKSWQKTSEKSNPLGCLTFHNYDKEEGSDKKSVNNSTLSLHIAAYENSIEETSDAFSTEYEPKKKNKIRKTLKNLFHESTKKDLFEIPRQQENQNNEPEIMQFKASQRLLNPNESISTPKTTINWKTPEMQKLLDDFINGILAFKDIQEFADHVNKICNTNIDVTTVQRRVFDRQKELRMVIQKVTPTVAAQNKVEPEVAGAPPRMDPPGLEEEDTVTHAELYQAYVNFWNSLNNCLEDGDKIRPTNGTYPSFQEAKNLWKHMKKPRERKLFWIATGFTHPEFPDDEEQFRREEANGLIDDTNVTTGAVATDESSDDEIPDLNDENTPPVVNFAVNAAGDALNRLYGGAPVGMEDISSDEDVPQEHINANVAANNLALPVNNGVGRPETPIALLREPVVTDPVPPVISPVRSQINSLNLTTLPQPNLPSKSAPAAPSPVSAWVTTEDGNEVVPDSQPDDIMIPAENNDYFMEEPDISPPRSPVPEPSQTSILSDSPVPTPQSSYSSSQIQPPPTAPKKITPKRKRVIVSDESDEAEETVKAETEETSYIDELIGSPENQTENPITSKKGKKRKQTVSPKPSTSKPRSRTRSAATATSAKPASTLQPRSRTRSANRDPEAQVARKTVKKRGNSRELDPDYNSDQSSDNDDSFPARRGFSRDIDNVNSGESSSSFETSSLDGFIVEASEEDEEESSDEEIMISDDNTQTAKNSQDSEDSDTSTTLNNDIFTKDDSVERDLPATIPKATVKNNQATPKTTPLLAHIGKSRYSSDAVTTPRRSSAFPFSSKPSPFTPRSSNIGSSITRRRESANADSSAGRRNLNASSFNNRTPASSSERPGPSTARRRAPSKERQESIAASRRSTSTNRFGSATRFTGEDGSDSSRSNSVNNRNSSSPIGYERVSSDRKVPFGDDLLIVELQNGKKFFRKYRFFEGTGLHNGLGCNVYYCVNCKSRGQESLLKVLKRSNNTYAETSHHRECKMKDYSLLED